MTTENTSVGQEIMRVAFSANPKVKEYKEKFAKLFDEVSEMAMEIQNKIDTPPTIYSDETIKNHMEFIKKGEESIRCYAEACKILEMSCMYVVKGITA